MKREQVSFTFEGKRYYIKADTKEEAIARAAIRKKDLEEGKRNFSSTMPVNEWFDKYIATYKQHCEPSTIANYKGLYDKAIRPFIGALPIKSVKPLQCQKIMNSLNGKSKSYVHKIEVILNDMFNRAIENELINTNPAKSITVPKAEAGQRRALTPDERRQFLNACDELGEIGLYGKVLFYTGLRPSEAARIHGEDITGNKLKVRGTKTEASNRTVPIPDALILPNTKGLLFRNSIGNPLDKDGCRWYWEAIKNKMKKENPVADDLTAYCLRHDYCTRLQEAGVPIDVARRLMGHSSITMTSKIYTHESESTIDNALKLINGLEI